jgi:hypothetical protein
LPGILALLFAVPVARAARHRAGVAVRVDLTGDGEVLPRTRGTRDQVYMWFPSEDWLLQHIFLVRNGIDAVRIPAPTLVSADWNLRGRRTGNPRETYREDAGTQVDCSGEETSERILTRIQNPS